MAATLDLSFTDREPGNKKSGDSVVLGVPSVLSWQKMLGLAHEVVFRRMVSGRYRVVSKRVRNAKHELK